MGGMQAAALGCGVERRGTCPSRSLRFSSLSRWISTSWSTASFRLTWRDGVGEGRMGWDGTDWGRVGWVRLDLEGWDETALALVGVRRMGRDARLAQLHLLGHGHRKAMRARRLPFATPLTLWPHTLAAFCHHTAGYRLTSFLICATRWANLHVEIDSSVWASPAWTVATITVLQFPPSESRSTEVSIELR